MRMIFLLITLAVFGFSEGLKNENILIGIPSGYKMGYKAYDPKTHYTLAEFIPKEESVENWSQMLTVNIYHKNLPYSADAYAANIKSLWEKSCNGSYTQNISEGVENGYKYALVMLFCPKSAVSKKEEYTWLKAIKGNDSFYVIQKAFTISPPKEQIIQTMQYLKKVQLCDTRLGNCPKGMQ